MLAKFQRKQSMTRTSIFGFNKVHVMYCYMYIARLYDGSDLKTYLLMRC